MEFVGAVVEAKTEVVGVGTVVAGDVVVETALQRA